MTAHIISSGRSCGCDVLKLFLECVGGFIGSNITPEYFIYGKDPESCRRLKLTIHFALV